MTALPVFASHETLLPVKTDITANIWLMLKVKTLLPVFVLRNRWAALATALLWKKNGRTFIKNWLMPKTIWNITTKTCKIWNLPLNTVNCGCCNAATVKEPQPLLFVWQLKWLKKAWLPMKKLSCALVPTN